MTTWTGAKFRPAMDTEAVASVVTVVLPTNPWASAAPLPACAVVEPSAPAVADPGCEPHVGPAQAAPDVAEPEPPAATDTLWVCAMLTGVWLSMPPGSTLVVSRLLATLGWAVNPVAATDPLLGVEPVGVNAAADVVPVVSAVADPD